MYQSAGSELLRKLRVLINCGLKAFSFSRADMAQRSIGLGVD